MANPNGRPRSETVKLTKTARECFDRQLAEKLPDIFTALFEAGTKEKDTAALSLPVHFAFGSADILPAAGTQLDALADGIKLLPPNSIVTVEGHTDAAGSDAYNLELSRVRARAVRDYLVQHHGIEAARLKTVGYGESRPIEGSDPYAALNRRVQFRGS